ncbi:MAG: phosphatidate cytidylyltransferase [Holdemanella sp.]|nr:phosphatidate cytidylyltransferase [Holdemanella sp.]
MNKVWNEKTKQRIITAIAIVMVVFIPVYFGGYFLEVLGLFIVATSAYEWMRVQKNFTTWPSFVMPMIAIFVALTRVVPSNLIYAYMLFCIIVIWAIPVFTERLTIANAFWCIAYFIIFSMIYQNLIIFAGNQRYLWTIILATYGSDTGAYFVGSKFGKNKMNPRISPNKSWEGFFGGCAAGFLISLLVSMFYIGKVNFLLNLMICITAPATAELGDLCFSAIKREAGIKDFSKILPGHGGILDRTDSLLMNFMVFGILYAIIM